MEKELSRRDFIKIFGIGSAGLISGGFVLRVLFPEVPEATPAIEAVTTIETAKGETTAFEKLLAPFIEEARKRRRERAEIDPEFSKRVDLELNKTRINFLLFGWGETYEPPNSKPDIIGSQTILSYDMDRKMIDLVSCTHDIRAPEIERYQQAQGKTDVYPIRIDRAYFTGGFPLMQQVLENATGLSIDFQIAFPDEAIVNLVNDVFGKVAVNVPNSFRVNEFLYKGKLYEKAEFPAGPRELGGLQVVQFIKTVPVETATKDADRRLEHNARKALILKAILEHWQNLNSFEKVSFLAKAAVFLNTATRSGLIAYDFDSIALLSENLGSVVSNWGSFLLDRNGQSVEPKINRTLYLVDVKQGDGGVRWVVGNPSPIIRKELAEQRYIDKNMEVPYDGNPYAKDLVTGYWPSVRQLVKKTLT